MYYIRLVIAQFSKVGSDPTAVYITEYHHHNNSISRIHASKMAFNIAIAAQIIGITTSLWLSGTFCPNSINTPTNTARRTVCILLRRHSNNSPVFNCLAISRSKAMGSYSQTRHQYCLSRHDNSCHMLCMVGLSYGKQFIYSCSDCHDKCYPMDSCGYGQYI